MFMYHILPIMALLYGTFVVSMENPFQMLMSIKEKKKSLLTQKRITTFKTILENSQSFECAAPKIRALADIEADGVWESILVSKRYVGKLLDYIQGEKEIAAVILGTPGAIAWGKEYITKNPQAEQNIKNLLFDVVQWSDHILEWPYEDYDIIKSIFDLGIDVQSVDKGNINENNPGCAPLVTAATRNKIKLVTLLLKYGADIETKDPWNGSTALMNACLYGREEIVDLLIEYKANVNAVGYKEETALMWAAGCAHVEIVKKLIAAGTDVHAKNKNKQTALDALTNGSFNQFKEQYTAIIQLLKDAGAVEKFKY